MLSILLSLLELAVVSMLDEGLWVLVSCYQRRQPTHCSVGWACVIAPSTSTCGRRLHRDLRLLRLAGHLLVRPASSTFSRLGLFLISILVGCLVVCFIWCLNRRGCLIFIFAFSIFFIFFWSSSWKIWSSLFYEMNYFLMKGVRCDVFCRLYRFF